MPFPLIFSVEVILVPANSVFSPVIVSPDFSIDGTHKYLLMIIGYESTLVQAILVQVAL